MPCVTQTLGPGAIESRANMSGTCVAQKRAHTRKSGHIKDEEIAAFVSGSASSRRRESITAHLAGCPLCRKIVAEVMTSRQTVRDPAKRTRGPAKR